MTTEMQDHYRDEEILRISMKPDINIWQEKTNFLEGEIEFFNELLKHPTFLDEKRNGEDLNFLLRELENFSKENKLHSKTLQEFKDQLENIRECDDVQCENQYVMEHQLLKSTLEKHWKKSRTVKGLIMQFISKNLS